MGAIMTLSAGGDIRFKTRLVEGASDNGLSNPTGSCWTVSSG